MREEPSTVESSCFGYCSACARRHVLPVGRAHQHARRLMREFEEIRRLDYLVPSSAADPQLAFDHLFPGERGHMFGVLECQDKGGKSVVLRAFSSLHEGVRQVDGWVPPILSPETYRDILLPGQAEIKKLTGLIQSLDPASSQCIELLGKRRKLSQGLMGEIQSLYWFHNFRGEKRPLREAFLFPESIPGGVGECCAPKLLNHAARTGLTPVGIAEFYWGAASPSGKLKAGEFYPCCEARCRPILGFMLCGVQGEH
ncbi:MAG TPA: hypothetical protein EYG54_05250 [Myxococcales bacterium]|nr:hypothetical protein [Myxococcales bacterium]